MVLEIVDKIWVLAITALVLWQGYDIRKLKEGQSKLSHCYLFLLDKEARRAKKEAEEYGKR